MAWASKAAQTQVARAGNQVDLAGQQLGLANQVGGQFGKNAQQMYGVLSPEVSSLINSPGFDPATLSAITNVTEGAAAAPFDTASTEANNQVARTRNTAGIAESQDKLAQEKSQAVSNAGNQVTMENQGQKNLQQQLGLNLGSSLYGENAQGQLGALGAGTGALNAGTGAVNAGTGAVEAQNAASGPSWLQALTGIGGMITAPLGSGGARVGGGKP
jgi:hypothetical protein